VQTEHSNSKNQQPPGGKKPSFNWDLIMSSSQKKQKSSHNPEAIFETLIGLSGELLLIINRDGLIRYANPAVEAALGYPLPELQGIRLKELVVSDDREVLEQYVHALIADSRENVAGIRITLSDTRGLRRHFELTGHNLLDSESVGGLVLTMQDNTPLREAEIRLQERESRYEQVVNRASEGIAILQERRLKYVNPWLAKTLGYTVEELLEAPFTDFVVPEALEKAITFYDRIREIPNDRPVMETVVRHKDEHTIHVAVNASVIPYQQAPAELVFVRDITEQKHMEEALLNSERDLRHLFDHMHEGVYRMDTEGKYLMVNPSLSRMLGYDSPEELIGERVEDLTHITKTTIQRFRDELDTHGELTNFQYLCRTKDERYVVCKENAHLVKDDEGNPLFYEGTVEDITEIKDLENQLRKSQKMEVLGRVASGIAHDFNNILANISGTAQLLERKLTDEDQLKYIDIIESGITLGQTLGDRILTFANSRRPELKTVSGSKFLEEFQTLASPTAGEKIRIEIESKVKDDWLHIDLHQIQRVLFNLVTNAVDALPEGGTIRITLEEPAPEVLRKYHRESEKKFLCISVNDDGQGMDSHTLDHLFEPFFSTKSSGKGTGLGMTIAYNIMQLHGGWIDVQSQAEEGTTVMLGVPAGTADISDPDSGQKRRDIFEVLGRGEEILLVDDDEAICGILETEFKRMGYKTWVATDGEQALQVYDSPESTIDLVVTDIKMPKVDGLDLLEALRKRLPDLPVVAITGVAERNRIRENDWADFNVVLNKPLQIQRLLRAIRQLLD